MKALSITTESSEGFLGLGQKLARALDAWAERNAQRRASERVWDKARAAHRMERIAHAAPRTTPRYLGVMMDSHQA